jgi:hypothetical protein
MKIPGQFSVKINTLDKGLGGHFGSIIEKKDQNNANLMGLVLQVGTIIAEARIVRICMSFSILIILRLKIMPQLIFDKI